MNYAVNSASTVNYQRRRSCSPSFFTRLQLPPVQTSIRRITIKVGGERFQTYEETLARYPTSLLGSHDSRAKYYDNVRHELVFPECNKHVFNAILFFYQARILSRPEDVTSETFAREVKFFGLTEFAEDLPKSAGDVAEVTPAVNGDGSYRERIWHFLEHSKTTRASYFAKLNLVLLFAWIILQCALTQLDVGGNAPSTWASTTTCSGCLLGFDIFFVIWFTLDYVAHALTAPTLHKYISSPGGLVDFLTIFPYYLALATKHSRTLRAITFLRIFKLLKGARYSSGLRILVKSLTSSARDLPMWLLLMIIHIVFFASIVFYVEGGTGNPQFTNIPETMWFIVITMCAVGYGDVVPQSIVGKFVTAIAAISGIVIVFCIPAPTLKKNFTRLNEQYKERKKLKNSQQQQHNSIFSAE